MKIGLIIIATIVMVIMSILADAAVGFIILYGFTNGTTFVDGGLTPDTAKLFIEMFQTGTVLAAAPGGFMLKFIGGYTRIEAVRASLIGIVVNLVLGGIFFPPNINGAKLIYRDTMQNWYWLGIIGALIAAPLVTYLTYPRPKETVIAQRRDVGF